MGIQSGLTINEANQHLVCNHEHNTSNILIIQNENLKTHYMYIPPTTRDPRYLNILMYRGIELVYVKKRFFYPTVDNLS